MSRLAVSFGVALASALAPPAALAADLPSRKAPPVAPPPVFSWSGVYVGFNHGFGGGVLDANVGLASPLGALGTQTTNRAYGFMAGGEAGYQIQLSNGLVLGLETDLQWSDIRMSHQATSFTASSVLGAGGTDIHNTLDWFGTTRARVGFAFGRLLPYVTGGVAYGETFAGGAQIVSGALIGGSADKTNVGWSAGAGLDYALTDNLSARAEYLYIQIANATGPAAGVTVSGTPLVGSFSTGNFGAHILRTGLNWKFDRFGWPATGDLLGMLFEPPTVDWAGFYVGANGGYAGETLDATVDLASSLPLASSTSTQNYSSGFLFGGQAGYNFQFANHVVAGVETDAQWSNDRASHQATTGPLYVLTDVSNGLDWFGTTRARLGWAAGSTLAYVTGGVAYGDVFARGLQVSGGLFSGSQTQSKVGWAVGAGAEYALNENLSLKAEYLYIEFGGVSGPAYGVAIAPVLGSFTTSRFGANVGRLGLNWKFGGLTRLAPVVAKY